MAKSLYKMVRASLAVEPDSEEFVYAYAESILYLTGCSTAFEYQEYIKPLCDSCSAKVFRLSIQDQRYTNLDLKLFALRLARLPRNATPKDVMTIASSLSILHNDARMIAILYEENAWFKRSIRQAGRQVGRNNPLLDHKGIESLFNRVYPSVLKYIKFIAFKKLRFIVKSDNVGFEDLHSELSTKMLQAFYSMIPVQATDQHIINYLKRVVHNHCINMIKSRTSQKRGRLVNVGTDKNNEAQFSLLCVSQNQISAGVDEDGNEVDVLNVANDSHSKFELQFSISEVLDSVKSNKKKYRFLSLLLGTEDKEFTEWLRSQSLCRVNEDNTDVQVRTTVQLFNTYVADFLNVSYRQVETFLGSLRDLVEA